MALSSAVITFDVADLLGVDFGSRRVVAWTTTNIPNNTIIDTAANQIRLGGGKVDVAGDGRGSFTVWVPGAGANPASWQQYFHFKYATRGNGSATTRTFGPYTLTGSADLADLEQEQAVPPTYLSQVTALLDEYVDAAAASAAAAAGSAGAAVAAELAANPGYQIASKRGRWPVLSITTVGDALGRAKPILNREDYVDGYCRIAEVDVDPGQSFPLKIRGRGNSTWALPKKPYRLNFTTAVGLLGMTAVQKNWALLANYLDASKINGAFAFRLGAALNGLDWTPQARFCEVELNGDYIGLYQATDLVRMEAGRVALTAASGTTGLALTGAYLMEIDARYADNGDPGFTTSHGVPIAFDTPDGTNATQAAYVQNWVAGFETALFGANYQDPTSGYARFIDRDSFIDWYWVNELVKNWDSVFYSSCKLYKTRDTASVPGRLFMGPLWDFDLSLGLTFNGYQDPYGWHTRQAIWYARLWQDPTFRQALFDRWPAVVAALGEWEAWMDQTVDALGASIDRDDRRWSLITHLVKEVTDRKVWLRERIYWITQEIARGVTEYQPVYPATY